MKPKTLDRKCVFAVLMAILAMANANCKMHDAKWKKNSKGPSVTQPSKTDPSRVMLAWDKILENSRCVDEFTIFYWKSGESKERGQRKVVPKSSTSAIIDVVPCVSHHFQVEYMEHDLMGRERKLSAKSTFKTVGMPQILDQDRRKFQVGYQYSLALHAHDLSKASVTFPANILKFPDCAKYIEISGQQLPKTNPPRTFGMAREQAQGRPGNQGKNK